jgi:hypothetical protein
MGDSSSFEWSSATFTGMCFASSARRRERSVTCRVRMYAWLFPFWLCTFVACKTIGSVLTVRACFVCIPEKGTYTQCVFRLVHACRQETGEYLYSTRVFKQTSTSKGVLVPKAYTTGDQRFRFYLWLESLAPDLGWCTWRETVCVGSRTKEYKAT